MAVPNTCKFNNIKFFSFFHQYHQSLRVIAFKLLKYMIVERDTVCLIREENRANESLK